MNIKIIEEKDNYIKFSLSTTPSKANALRRTIINNVPVYAIDEIMVYENTSSLFDEYIAHRLGMLPLITPEKKGGDVLFYLDEIGPKRIFASDLQGEDDEVKVAKPLIPIIELSEGQKLRLEARAVKDIGKKHSKFQPGLVGYEIKDKEIEFYVETFYQMSPKEIVKRAVKNLIKDIDLVIDQLK